MNFTTAIAYPREIDAASCRSARWQWIIDWMCVPSLQWTIDTDTCEREEGGYFMSFSAITIKCVRIWGLISWTWMHLRLVCPLSLCFFIKHLLVSIAKSWNAFLLWPWMELDTFAPNMSHLLNNCIRFFPQLRLPIYFHSMRAYIISIYMHGVLPRHLSRTRPM